MMTAEATATETATEMKTVNKVKAAPRKKGKVKSKVKAKVKKGKVGAKGAKKTGSKIKASTGQSGPEIDGLGLEDLNDKELKVVSTLNGKGSGAREMLSIEDLATSCFKSRGAKQANSWVRNSLRRLFCGGWLEKVDRGRYKISENGRKRMQRAEA